MKRILILNLLLIPLITLSQSVKPVTQKDLVGVWQIEEVIMNGLKIDKSSSTRDEITLRENNTQTTTDKAFNYEENGPWRLIDDNHLELTDSKKNQKKLFEIVSLQNDVLKLRIKYDATTIEMTLTRLKA